MSEKILLLGGEALTLYTRFHPPAKERGIHYDWPCKGKAAAFDAVPETRKSFRDVAYL